MEKESKTEENPLIAKIREKPKRTLLIMMALLGLGGLFHINDGYLKEPESFMVKSKEDRSFERALDDFKKDTVRTFGKDMSNIMQLMDAEEELEELLKAENLDTTRLRQLEEQIRKIEYNGKN